MQERQQYVVRGDEWLSFEPLITSIVWVFEAYWPAAAMVTMLCIVVVGSSVHSGSTVVFCISLTVI